SATSVTKSVAMPAIGATATVHLPNGRNLVAQVDGGNGHSGARSTELHFGLGEVKEDIQLPIEVQWRDTTGQVQQTSLLLSPGVHTVLLGETAKVDSSAT
ncbi:MAG TPA: RNA-binding protein, partial [Cyanobacteria bacterium UBA11148]|nr:RNA-binding protein [Cyanobacteria bacterium UBA11148]